MALIEVRELGKIYQTGEVAVEALRGVTVSIAAGEFVAIMGPSGSGKSTFMHILGCLDKPTSGIYELDGQDVGKMNRDQLASLRNHKLGFVFQTFNLLPRTTALENIELPLLYNGGSAKERHTRARARLLQVGLQGREHHHPNQLSGGQQQRVAIARALAMAPQVMFFDEATSALDPEMVKGILQLIADLGADGMTMIVVTHEMGFARSASDTVVFMDRGKVVESGPPEQIFEAAQTDRLQRFLSQVL
jgi:polar amino acid transport system ATP-binding protein